MKIYIPYFFIFMCLTSCSSGLMNKRYIYIDADKEQDLELIMFKDSTFILKDMYGCNQMSQKGKWEYIDNNKNSDYVNYILSDTTKFFKSTNIHNKVLYSFISNVNNNKYIIKEDQYFPIVKTDTVSFVKNDKILFFRGLTFTKSNKNIEQERIKILEERIIMRIGKEMYIKTIGEGISIKKARENLSYCK
jgi:hypothetical protein